MKDNKKKSSGRLRLINLQKEGRGVSKSAADMKPGIGKFFTILKNNFGKLVTTNIIMVLGNFPLFFLIINLSGYFKAPYQLPMSDLFQNLSGFYIASGGATPYQMTLFALEGMQYSELANTVVNYIFYGLSALTLFTFGIVNAGTAYILRNLASGEPVFVWHDFKYAVKRNYKQAIPFGIIDTIICGFLAFNIISLVGSGEFLASMLFWSNVVISIVYFFMRYYIYVQMVTFKLSVFKILKNSLIFSLVGLKRNLVAFLGIALGILLELVLLLGTGGILVPFAIAAPLTILFSGFAFMKVFASYYKIKEIMIDPYQEPSKPAAPDDEPIMRDDVTEREKLEKIKKQSTLSS